MVHTSVIVFGLLWLFVCAAHILHRFCPFLFVLRICCFVFSLSPKYTCAKNSHRVLNRSPFSFRTMKNTYIKTSWYCTSYFFFLELRFYCFSNERNIHIDFSVGYNYPMKMNIEQCAARQIRCNWREQQKIGNFAQHTQSACNEMVYKEGKKRGPARWITMPYARPNKRRYHL